MLVTPAQKHHPSFRTPHGITEVAVETASQLSVSLCLVLLPPLPYQGC